MKYPANPATKQTLGKRAELSTHKRINMRHTRTKKAKGEQTKRK